MSSKNVYASVITTASAEPEAFREAVRHFLTAGLGGVLLLSVSKLLGAVAAGPTASAIGHHTAEHYGKTPLASLAVALLLMAFVQLGGLWVMRKEVNKWLVRVGTVLLETFSHMFSTGLGVMLAVSVFGHHLVDPIFGRSATFWSVVLTWFILTVTGLCGYFCVALTRRGVAIEGKRDTLLGIAVTVFGVGLLVLGLFV